MTLLLSQKLLLKYMEQYSKSKENLNQIDNSLFFNSLKIYNLFVNSLYYGLKKKTVNNYSSSPLYYVTRISKEEFGKMKELLQKKNEETENKLINGNVIFTNKFVPLLKCYNKINKDLLGSQYKNENGKEIQVKFIIEKCENEKERFIINNKDMNIGFN